MLPFQNLSAGSANVYVAGGLHDELLTQLSKVAVLKVISRTSVLGYQSTTTPLTQIADELNVGTIVEGSVQVVSGWLRMNVQLIDAVTDQHLWADRYDRTLDDAFAIQSDLAQKIVAAVGAALSGDERSRLAEGPTANAEACRLSLQGLEYWRRPGYLRQNVELAQDYYERALAPDLPEAHVAMGRVHYQRRAWRRALDEYSIALGGLPNDRALWTWLGYTHRRMGEWDEALVAYQKASELDPRDANLHEAILNRAWTQVLSAGNLAALQQALSAMPASEESGGEHVSARYQRCTLLMFSRDVPGLLSECLRAPDMVFTGQVSFVPTSLFAGWAHQLDGDGASSRAAFESARATLDRELRGLPNDWRLRASRGLTLAGLGHRGEARREADWLRSSDVYARDAYDGPFLAEDRARILAQAGYADEALDEIERLLSQPSWLSVHTLRLDPRWDPIRNHPRFEALMKKHGS